MVCGVTVEVRVASTSLQTTTISMYIPGSANPYTTSTTVRYGVLEIEIRASPASISKMA